MPRVAYQTPSRIPPGKWRVIISASKITDCARVFAICVLDPLASKVGRIRPTHVRELARRYAFVRDRARITPRRIYQLMAELVRAGVITRDGRPAPGRCARYRAQLPGVDIRPMVIRRRGIQPERIHASFNRELAHETGPAP